MAAVDAAAAAAQGLDDDQRLRDIQREYVEILDDNGAFADQVKDLIKSASEEEQHGEQDGPGRRTALRLVVNINEVRRRNPARVKGLMANVAEEVLAFQRALREFVGAADASFAKTHANTEFVVGFEGSFGASHLTPRTLTSAHLNHLVCIEGIVTKCSLVKPKISRSVHYCPATTKSVERTYTDLTSLQAFPSTAAYPTQDEDGNPLQTEFGLSVYKDHQTLTIQELPEKAPTGQLPRSVDIICEHDLVDVAKPGDRLQVVGSYRCLPSRQGGFTSGSFRSVLIANNVILTGQSQDGTAISGEDVQRCKKLNKQQKNIFDLLAKSLAPSIHGHEYVKRALLCMLLGGVEKVLPNGSRLRGDINVLLIGDPSVAKSQMLRFVLSTAERAVTTTGRGSSGVGLTAAVTTDQETGDRRLEAGAMVLADRGVVCIDEFDKMTDMDRTAIHEVMEQGRVTIAKAGIHARLNARCSVLAAANPVYGRYDPFKTPMENIGLQDSLLSRFDLLFILLDSVDVDTDRKISDHVVRTHRYRNPRENDGEVTVINTAADELSTANRESAASGRDKETPIWEKFDSLLSSSNKKEDRLLSKEFVKKYVMIAKHLKPVLTEKACEILGEEYSRLRSQDWENTQDLARTQPVTARALETLIRLSTAHAKARLSTTVDAKDADFAIELVQFAYFKKVLEKEKKRARDEDEDEESEEEEVEEAADDPKDEASAPAAKRPRQEDAASLDEKTMGAFKTALSGMFEREHTQQLPLADIQKLMAGGELKMDEKQVLAAIEAMMEENKVMLSGEILYLI